jgi:dihydroorotase
MEKTIILKNAHVIDPLREINGIADVAIRGAKIAPLNSVDEKSAEIIDLRGHYLTPGWVDIHVHAYGTLGFADPDSVGVYQGVTSFVEAGGPGIGTLDEFFALMDGLETSLYVGPFIRPMGLLGLNFIEGNIRTLGEVPITKWIDFAQEHRDSLRYLKCNAMGDYGPGTLNVTKGLAQILKLPLYMHIGEFQNQKPEILLAYEAFKIAESGDMITHIYHGNLGRVVDQKGKLLPIVKEAGQRGVLFDLGFGGYNFSWDVAEQAYAEGLVPYTISSDLQQFNVVRPAKSLANVLSVMMHLGMSLTQLISCVTAHPAKALSLGDRAGTLREGLPADITVFKIEDGSFELTDCYSNVRTAKQQIVPVMTFKNGKRFDVDMVKGQDEANWFLQISEDQIPAAAYALSNDQRAFLGALADELTTRDWTLYSAEYLDVEKALELQQAFHAVLAKSGLPLRAGLRAVYSSFIDQKFTMQIGLFLMRLDRAFAVARLKEVAKMSEQMLGAKHEGSYANHYSA